MRRREKLWRSSLIRRRRGNRFEAGDVVVVLGEPDALEAAEIRLLQGTK
jgi:Trk K+ transport system NAD-binding subunit